MFHISILRVGALFGEAKLNKAPVVTELVCRPDFVPKHFDSQPKTFQNRKIFRELNNVTLAELPSKLIRQTLVLTFSSVKESIHSLLCCKITMQTNCGLTNFTGNSPETGFSFSFWRLVNIESVIVSFPHCIPIFAAAFPFSFQGGHQALKNKLVKKQTIFIQQGSQSRTANATAFVKAGQFSRGKEITKQWNYYETIASFTLFDKRLGEVRHVKPDV